MYTHIHLMQFHQLSHCSVLVKVYEFSFNFPEPFIILKLVIGHTVICEERQEAPYDQTIATLLCAIPSLLFCVHGKRVYCNFTCVLE